MGVQLQLSNIQKVQIEYLLLDTHVIWGTMGIRELTLDENEIPVEQEVKIIILDSTVVLKEFWLLLSSVVAPWAGKNLLISRFIMI